MNNFVIWLVESSANPEKVSATIQGILIQYIGIIIFAAQHFGVPLSHTQVVNDIGLFSAFIGTAIGVFGLLRKMYYMIYPLK